MSLSESEWEHVELQVSSATGRSKVLSEASLTTAGWEGTSQQTPPSLPCSWPTGTQAASEKVLLVSRERPEAQGTQFNM